MTARAVGALFIVASATAIVGGSLLLPIGEPDYLQEAASTETQVVSGALIEMVLVLSVVGIAVLLFPVLRRHNEGLALGYVGVRILEAALLLAGAVSALIVMTLSLDGGAAGAELGSLALTARDWTYLLGSKVMFGVSAVILYALLYRANLVPAWLSVWGLVGGALILVGGVLDTYSVDTSELVQGLLVAPIGLNEMVLAVLLIVKGFNPASRATEREIALAPEAPAAARGLAPGSGR